jgi:hypothetical protein
VATHDYVISNGTGSAVRSDLNGALAAIVSQNSNASEPATMYAYQWWADTTTGLLKIRNAANSAWVTIGTLASANLGLLPLAGGTMTGVLAVTAGTAALPGIAVSGDPNTGIYSPGADQVGIATGGTSRIVVDASGNVNIDSGTLYVDNTNNRVGIGGITSPLFPVDVNGTIYTRGRGSTFGVLFDDWRIYNSTSPGALVFNNGSDRATLDSSGRFLVGVSANTNGGILQLSSGITFPATAVAASDANTLDDYEEGTWTPNQGSGLVVVGTFSSTGRYTKVGNLVYVTGNVSGSTSIAITAGSILCSNLIFTQALDGCGGNCTNYTVNQTAGLYATGGSTNLYATSALTASISIFFGFTFRV